VYDKLLKLRYSFRIILYVKRNSDMRSCNHCCHGKAINITYSETERERACVCVGGGGCTDLDIQHKKRMRLIFHVAILALPYVSPLSNKCHHFREGKNPEHKMCVLTFSTNVSNISHSQNNSARYDHKCWSSCKVAVILVRF